MYWHLAGLSILLTHRTNWNTVRFLTTHLTITVENPQIQSELKKSTEGPWRGRLSFSVSYPRKRYLKEIVGNSPALRRVLREVSGGSD